MEHVLQTIMKIVVFIDLHEGSIAMFGIAISVYIFRREVTNNYFTLEKDNFNDLFKDITLKQLPEKMAGVEAAYESEWSGKFSELMDVLEEMLKKAKYFKYSMPYFYNCLKLTKDEIGDLERHDNRKIYRNSAKQTQLIERKCRKVIQTINDASKGRVMKIIWRQNRLVSFVRNFLVKKFIDRPIDHILDTIIETDRKDSLKIYVVVGKEKYNVNSESLKKLKNGNLIIEPNNNQIKNVKVKPIETSEKFCFGYFAGIRVGKRIGKIELKANIDRLVHVKKDGFKNILKWDDANIHKIVISWRMRDDNTHLFYNVLKIRLKDN